MNGQQPDKEYSAPEITEFGAVEEITQQSNKIGGATDEYSDTTPLVGSVVPASE